MTISTIHLMEHFQRASKRLRDDVLVYSIFGGVSELSGFRLAMDRRGSAFAFDIPAGTKVSDAASIVSSIRQQIGCTALPVYIKFNNYCGVLKNERPAEVLLLLQDRSEDKEARNRFNEIFELGCDA